jgi:hypothetical protein
MAKLQKTLRALCLGVFMFFLLSKFTIKAGYVLC